MSNKVGIVACSNGIARSQQRNIEQFLELLRGNGLETASSPYLYEKDGVRSGTGEERAKVLMDFYARDDIKAIFDFSGGDVANEILSYLDYDVIAKSKKTFWGYSDLTVVLNAMYTKCGQANVLYQVRNLGAEENVSQLPSFGMMISNDEMLGKQEMFDFDYEFLQGNRLSGVVVGGNIRCFLKLAGTPYFPDMTDKILLLEARSGGVPQMITYLNQLKQLGAFEKLNGILLGTFTQMEREGVVPTMEQLVVEMIKTPLPVVKTTQIGHGLHSKAIWIGKQLDILLKNEKNN